MRHRITIVMTIIEDSTAEQAESMLIDLTDTVVELGWQVLATGVTEV